MKHVANIDLPEHRSTGGFDHADIHAASDRLYVAHTGNDALDVIDVSQDRYVESIGGLKAVAGALVSQERDLVFTSNRGENSVSIFKVRAETDMFKVTVGMKPNGLAFDPDRNILLAANVGDPGIAGSYTLSVVDVACRVRIAEVAVPGRTRWAIYDAARETFFVNILSPARIVALSSRNPVKLSKEFEIPAEGPHGLDLDAATGRLLCACDAGILFAIDAASGRVLGDVALSGAPDVVFLNPRFGRLYVAVGDPGVIDVINVVTMQRITTVPTEAGAHTLALDRRRNKVYAFLPRSHCAAVFQDTA